MPALSQNFTFTINNTSTVSLNYPNTGTGALVYTSQKSKGDGYYGNSDGFHSIQINLTNFIGKIEIQGSLANDPGNADWVSLNLLSNRKQVDTTGSLVEVSTSSIRYNTSTSVTLNNNFIGNFVWVRSKISEFTQGSVNSIKYNH